jgi:uncharacterized protein YkwD
MRRSQILGLITLAVAVIGVLLVANAPEAPTIEAADTADLVPQIATSTTDDVRVLSETATSLIPDTDANGDPVEDHFETTTSTSPSTTTTQPGASTTTSAKATSTTAGNTSTTAAETEPPPAEAHFDGGAESSFASKINGLRSSNGLSSLSRSGGLDSEARSWAKTIGQNGSLSHSSISRLVPPWAAAAENVGTGGNVSSVFNALAGSSGHRNNMLGDYTHFGIGVWVDSEGRIWTVHVFAR